MKKMKKMTEDRKQSIHLSHIQSGDSNSCNEKRRKRARKKESTKEGEKE